MLWPWKIGAVIFKWGQGRVDEISFHRVHTYENERVRVGLGWGQEFLLLLLAAIN